MGVLKQKVRDVRYGRSIHTKLTDGEKLMFQEKMAYSTNRGILWGTVIVGMTNRRLILEWQSGKKNVAVPYQTILGWNVTNEIGGLTEYIPRVLTKIEKLVDIRLDEKTTVRLSAEKDKIAVLMNQLEMYCPTNK